jgi:hypothetical protein
MKFTNQFSIYKLTIFIIIINLACCFHSKIKITNATNTETNYNRLDKLVDPITNIFDIHTAKNLRDLAGLGYINSTSANEQMREIRKGAKKNSKKVSSLFKILFEKQGWEHLVTKTYGKELDNYCFTVIRNLKFKKFVFSFSGTKYNNQLLKQAFKSFFGLPYSKDKPYFKILEYNLNLYSKIKKDLINVLKKYKDPSITQYIFVGHSLGGAMASVAAFDFMQKDRIPKTHNSPVLFTFGQPRVGNYAFANEIMKTIPIVFRIVNKNDPVANGPLCKKDNERCINEFGKKKLDCHFNNYKEIYNKLPNKKKFYPFHFSGLILINKNNKIINCRTKSENPGDACEVKFHYKAHHFHVNYLGLRVSTSSDPKSFPYLKNMP